MNSTRCIFDTKEGLTALGPTLWVRIGLANLAGPFLALVDTGASVSCIDKGVALQLKLPQIDRWNMAGIEGPYQAAVHLGIVHIPALNWQIYGGFPAVNLVAGGQPHHALIGRDFLQHFTMTYEGSTGKVELLRQTGEVQTA